MSDKTRVLILGGGFAGLYAVVEFEKRSDLDLTTIVATMPQAP